MSNNDLKNRLHYCLNVKECSKCNYANDPDCILTCKQLVEECIKNISNRVEVVRCKDCKHRNTPDCKMWYQCVICGDYHHWERDEYFCSYGERKE